MRDFSTKLLEEAYSQVRENMLPSQRRALADRLAARAAARRQNPSDVFGPTIYQKSLFIPVVTRIKNSPVLFNNIEKAKEYALDQLEKGMHQGREIDTKLYERIVNEINNKVSVGSLLQYLWSLIRSYDKAIIRNASGPQ